MLPFLKQTKEASVVSPIDKVERKSDDPESYDVMDSVADDLISAIHAKDTKAVSEALKACLDLYQTEPQSEEGI